MQASRAASTPSSGQAAERVEVDRAYEVVGAVADGDISTSEESGSERREGQDGAEDDPGDKQ